MGYNGLLNSDIWSAYNNQAALALIKNTGAGVHYENRFMMMELGTSAGIFVLPALTGTFGFDIAHMGIEGFGETRIGAGYGKRLSKRLLLGVQFNYHLLNFTAGYPDLYTFTGEIGMIAEPVDNFYIGLHIFNPTAARLNSRYEDPVPVIYEIGAGYEITGKLMLTAEIMKSREDDMSPRFGIDYSLFKSFSFRSGVSFNPVEVCFGAGWISKNIRLDFAFSRHEVLGYTPQVSMSYSFGK
jgi:hypothetical protein